MSDDTFGSLILIGRPASGKSQIIDILRRTPLDVRRRKFHTGNVDVLDDFPFVWAWLEEDRILSERLGQPRLHTNADGSFKYPHQWHLLLERLSLEYQKRLRDDPTYHEHTTTLLEFARGSEHGGYEEALPHLGDDLLRRAAIVYVCVSLEEALRRNRARYNAERPDGTMEHALPDELMMRHYCDDDWGSCSAGDPGFLTVGAVRVPYVVFDNERRVETGAPRQLAARLEAALSQLWDLHCAR
jgi:hypothetical protein